MVWEFFGGPSWLHWPWQDCKTGRVWIASFIHCVIACTARVEAKGCLGIRCPKNYVLHYN